MRSDSHSNPDVCRETFTPVKPDALLHIQELKLQTNGIIALLRQQFENNRSPDVMRLYAMAISAYEEASMWAVKAYTSEDWIGVAPKQQPFEIPDATNK